MAMVSSAPSQSRTLWADMEDTPVSSSSSSSLAAARLAKLGNESAAPGVEDTSTVASSSGFSVRPHSEQANRADCGRDGAEDVDTDRSTDAPSECSEQEEASDDEGADDEPAEALPTSRQPQQSQRWADMSSDEEDEEEQAEELLQEQQASPKQDDVALEAPAASQRHRRNRRHKASDKWQASAWYDTADSWNHKPSAASKRSSYAASHKQSAAWRGAGSGRASYSAAAWDEWYSWNGGSWGAGASRKPQCQFYIGIEEDKDFHVVRKLLGPHGQNMKQIVEETGVKLRLRGRGSGFKEGPQMKEANEPLMLCLSATDSQSYEQAKAGVTDLLEDIYSQYRRFCSGPGARRALPELHVNIHEGPRQGSY